MFMSGEQNAAGQTAEKSFQNVASSNNLERHYTINIARTMGSSAAYNQAIPATTWSVILCDNSHHFTQTVSRDDT